MSTASETRPRRGLGFAPYFALSMFIVAGVLAIAMSTVLAGELRAAAGARLRAPDWSLLAAALPMVQVHVAAAFAAIGLGAVLMGARKGQRFHRVGGWTWAALVFVVAGSSIFITELKPGSWSFVHLFTAWTFIALPLGLMWAKRRKIAQHRRHMMGLFYGGFAINLAVAFIPGRMLWATFFG
jgi:uncharacterized membrane protein